jgi:protein SCO1/2
LESPEIGLDDKLGAFLPLDLTFVDEQGESMMLREIIDKPTILSLIYLNCTHSCPILLGGLAQVIEKLTLSPGEDYSVLTISFDEKDTPDIARDAKMNYLAAMGKPFPESAWRFLTGDLGDIKKVTDAVGFRFRREKEGFAHPVTLIILSPEGKVVRYLYGVSFLPFDLRMSLAEASEGKVGSTVQRVLLYCFSYDPRGKRYVFNILKVVGSVTILFILSFFIYLTLLSKKLKAR